MASLVRELDGDSLLLMYAADELDADDHAEFERMLSGDDGLQAGLATVRAGEAAVTAVCSGLDRLDPASATPSAQAVALRQVSRAVRQWQVERLVGRRPVAEPSRQPRFPGWAYPVGAVASVLLLVGVLARWGVKTDLVATEANRPPETATAVRARFIEDTFTGNPDASIELADAETQVQQLAMTADDTRGTAGAIDAGSR